jgi:hypothetical protein
MITKLKEKFSTTNKLTKILFKYGFIISYIIFIIGMYMLFSSDKYETTFIAQQIITASLSVFCEFIISAIFFDFLSSSGN